MAQLFSVGIDIGTSTTQVIFSRLTLENRSLVCGIPQIEITDKAVVYRSPIHFTPLTADDTLDLPRLKALLEDIFADACVQKDALDTGAVIITGESARKQNAEEVLQVLAEFSGDFVVAEAGPDLESVLAGRGAGAAELSRQSGRCVLNFDIGGGTTNAALFEDGRVLDSYALDIGGRLVRIDESGRICYLSPRLLPLLEAAKASAGCPTLGNPALLPSQGEPASPESLRTLAQLLAGVLCSLATGNSLSVAEHSLFIGHESLPMKKRPLITFSGGVAEFIYHESPADTLAQIARYGDFGPLLGQELRRTFDAAGLVITPSQEQIRATVIGAGSYSTSLSGSTIAFDESLLPMKNLPVMNVFEDGPEEYCRLAELIRQKQRLYPGRRAAVFFHGPTAPSYAVLRSIAEQLAGVLQDGNVVLLEHDFAKALGQTLAGLGCNHLICLDGISVADGNYIDIGSPVAGVVPVVVKTLICH